MSILLKGCSSFNYSVIFGDITHTCNYACIYFRGAFKMLSIECGVLEHGRNRDGACKFISILIPVVRY